MNSINDLMEELNALSISENAKKKIQNPIVHAKAYREGRVAGTYRSRNPYCLAFTGDEGRGKKKAAGLIAKMYKELGLLSRGHLVIADKTDLIGEYIGHTETKTSEVMEKSHGGVLFIENAYDLTDEMFRREAIDTLLKEIGSFKNNMVLIIAGEKERTRLFLYSNPGLQSRLVHRKINNLQFGLPAICPAASEKLADASASPAFSFLASQTAFSAKLSSIYFTVH